MKKHYTKIKIIDGLQVYSVPVLDITEANHGFAGSDIWRPSQKDFYLSVKKSILQNGTHICMKLADQKVVNLDAHALYKHVDQNDMVEVLRDKRLSLTDSK